MQDETMQFALQRYRKSWRDAEGFQDTHIRVHFCHFGPNLCPLCPAHYAFQDALGDLEWLLTKLHKKYKLDVYRHVKPNKTWTWNVRSQTAT